MTRVSTHSGDPPGSALPVGGSRVYAPAEGHGPIEWVMSTVIRKLAWSKLSDPKVALSVSGVGLLLGMLVGATAPNTMTLPIRLPLSYLLPSLSDNNVLATAMLYTGDVLAPGGFVVITRDRVREPTHPAGRFATMMAQRCGRDTASAAFDCYLPVFRGDLAR